MFTIKDKLLLINDLPGVGKIALGAMIPILSYMGYTIHSLPTALVSNTLDYGKFEIYDTTNYMENTINVWEQLNFSIEALATGFLINEKQVELIERLIYINRKNEPFIMVDPIMGDHGKLYNGIDDSRIDLMKMMIKDTDLTVPNITEAFMLVGQKAKTSVDSVGEARDLVDGLREQGTKNVVITSMMMGEEDFIYGYSHDIKDYFKVNFKKQNKSFPGTGDVFSSVLLGNVLGDKSLEESVRRSSEFVAQAIKDNEKYSHDTREGLFLEKHLHLLK